MEWMDLGRRKKPVMPNKVDKKTERLILQYVARFPEDGPRRIFYELQDEGMQIGDRVFIMYYVETD